MKFKVKKIKINIRSLIILVPLFICVYLLADHIIYKIETRRSNFTLDEYIAFVIYEEMGPCESKKEKRLISMDEPDIGIKRVYVFDDGVYWDEPNRDYNYLSHYIEIMKKLTTDKEFISNTNGFSIQYVRNYSDKYGNISKEVSHMITTLKNNYKKIKWENISTDNLIKVADTYWVNPWNYN